MKPFTFPLDLFDIHDAILLFAGLKGVRRAHGEKFLFFVDKRWGLIYF